MLPVLAITLHFAASRLFQRPRLGPRATVDQVHIAAWLVLAVVILLALTTGGGWIYRKEVRDTGQ
jgi:hypothetical protein